MTRDTADLDPPARPGQDLRQGSRPCAGVERAGRRVSDDQQLSREVAPTLRRRGWGRRRRPRKKRDSEGENQERKRFPVEVSIVISYCSMLEYVGASTTQHFCIILRVYGDSYRRVQECLPFARFEKKRTEELLLAEVYEKLLEHKLT